MASYLIKDNAMHDILRSIRSLEKYFTAACEHVKCQAKSESIDFDYSDEQINPHLYFRFRFRDKVAYISRVRHKQYRDIDSLGQPKYKYYTIVCNNFVPSNLTPLDLPTYLKITDIDKCCFGLWTDFGTTKNAFADVIKEQVDITCKDLF